MAIARGVASRSSAARPGARRSRVRRSAFSPASQHPVSGLDHVLAMIAVGVWGAQLGMPAIWILPVIFPMVMALRRHARAARRRRFRRRDRDRGVGAAAGSDGAARSRRRWPSRRPWSACSRSFTGTRTEPSCRKGRAGCSTASGSWSRPAACMARASRSATVHRFARGRVALRVAGALVAVGGLYFLYRGLSMSNRTDRRSIVAAATAVALACPASAHAHLVQSGLGPFYDGIAHFALSPDDWLFALAVALLGGLSGARGGRTVLFLLPAGVGDRRSARSRARHGRRLAGGERSDARGRWRAGRLEPEAARRAS